MLTFLAHGSVGHLGFRWWLWLRLWAGVAPSHVSLCPGRQGSSQSEHVLLMALATAQRSMSNSARVMSTGIPLVRGSHMVQPKSRSREVYSAGDQGVNINFYSRRMRKCNQQSNPSPTAFFVRHFLWLTLGLDTFPLLLLSPTTSQGNATAHPLVSRSGADSLTIFLLWWLESWYRLQHINQHGW